MNGLTDVDGTHSDWLELYNPTAIAVALDGWSLTDDALLPAKWTFPNELPETVEVTLPAGERMVVFASNKNRRVAGQEFHTNFALGKGGEYLGLVRSDGTVAFEYAPSFPAQADDISYGVLDTDPAAFRFFNPPTPGAPNTTEGVGVVAEVNFSVGRGFYDAPFQVALTSPTAGAAIRYTLDGSPPSETTGTVYTGPITVSTTATLRAIAYKAGFKTANINTQTYIFLDDVIHQPRTIPGWPNPVIASLTEDYQMDPDVVNNPAYSGLMEKALTDIPTMSLVVKQSDMWDASGEGGFYRTDDVEKPVSVEILYPHEPGKNVQADGNVEGHSHQEVKRSLRLTFRSEGPGDSRLVSTLMQDAVLNGTGATDEFKRLVLRAGYNMNWIRAADLADRTTYAEDQWVRDTQLALSGDGPRGTFVHLYINGIYWGLYNPTERPDEHFTSAYYGGDNEDWLAVSHSGVKDGDPTRWYYLTGTLKNKDMSVLNNYRELEQYLDTTNFSDYLLTHFYAGVTDWPGNNFWSGNRNNPAGPAKFFSWDGEYSFGSGLGSPDQAWVHPRFTRDKTKNDGTAISNLFNSIKANPEFKMLFADRAYKAVANGGALTDAAAQARWDALTASIRDAVIGESARWGDSNHSVPRTRDGTWTPEVQRKRNYMAGNGADLIAALRAQGYYPVSNPATFAKRGGQVQAGYNLKLTNPNSGGTIYYTTDGSDPRAVGGGVAAGALAYTSAGIPLAQDTRVRVRVRSGSGEWSAADEASFVISNAAPFITEHPASRSVGKGQPAMFSVEAGGTPPLSYQWQRNDADIPGATTATYTLPAATLGDDHATFRVVVTNSFGTATSNRATLNVSEAVAVSLRASADAYVRDGTYAGQNFGAAADLVVKRSANLGNTRESYLRFSLADIGDVTDGKLRVFGRSTTTQNVGVALYGVSNTSWTEGGVTWANKPASGATALGTKTIAGTSGQWYEFDVTSYLQQQKTAGATAVSFVLKASGVTDAQALFNSDENAASKPQLAVAHTVAPQEQALVVSSSSVTVPEGGNASFTVKLAAEPASDVTVTVTRQSGDGDLTGGGEFVFNATNWNTPQAVTIAAAADLDAANGSAVFAVTAAGLETKLVTATEADDDIVTPVTLRAAADAYVRDGTYSGQNFGGATDLVVKRSANLGNTRETYVRFSLGSLPAVGSAKLRLYGRSSTSTQSVAVSMYAASNVTWSETGLTWSNKPAAGTALIGTKTVAGTGGAWYEFDVTQYVQQQKAAGATGVTFVLKASGVTDAQALFTSDEATANRPELVATPAAVTTVSLRSPADAYVRDGTYAGQNFGSAADLVVKRSANLGNSREAYVSFDLSSVATIATGKLRFFGRLSDTTSASLVTTVYPASGADWAESTINWNTRPEAGTTSLGTITVAGTTGKWYELDVSTFLKAEKAAGRNRVTFVLRNLAVSNAQTLFVSDEASANRPELVVQPAAEAPQALVVSAGSVTAPEGGSATFTVRLAKQPSVNVSVSISHDAGEEDLEASPGTLTFSPQNWDQPQTVTVIAPEDADSANGTAVFTLSALGMETKTVTVTEGDNDASALPVTLLASDASYAHDGT